MRQTLACFATTKCLSLGEIAETCLSRGVAASNPQVRLTALHWLADSLEAVDGRLEAKQLHPCAVELPLGLLEVALLPFLACAAVGDEAFYG